MSLADGVAFEKQGVYTKDPAHRGAIGGARGSSPDAHALPRLSVFRSLCHRQPASRRAELARRRDVVGGDVGAALAVERLPRPLEHASIDAMSAAFSSASYPLGRPWDPAPRKPGVLRLGERCRGRSARLGHRAEDGSWSCVDEPDDCA